MPSMQIPSENGWAVTVQTFSGRGGVVFDDRSNPWSAILPFAHARPVRSSCDDRLCVFCGLPDRSKARRGELAVNPLSTTLADLADLPAAVRRLEAWVSELEVRLTERRPEALLDVNGAAQIST